MVALGKIASQEQDYDKAIEYFKQVIDDTDRKATQRDEAKKLLAEAKKLRRKKKWKIDFKEGFVQNEALFCIFVVCVITEYRVTAI